MQGICPSFSPQALQVERGKLKPRTLFATRAQKNIAHKRVSANLSHKNRGRIFICKFHDMCGKTYIFSRPTFQNFPMKKLHFSTPRAALLGAPPTLQKSDFLKSQNLMTWGKVWAKCSIYPPRFHLFQQPLVRAALPGAPPTEHHFWSFGSPHFGQSIFSATGGYFFGERFACAGGAPRSTAQT